MKYKEYQKWKDIDSIIIALYNELINNKGDVEKSKKIKDKLVWAVNYKRTQNFKDKLKEEIRKVKENDNNKFIK